jgi:hypothetical protein
MKQVDEPAQVGLAMTLLYSSVHEDDVSDRAACPLLELAQLPADQVAFVDGVAHLAVGGW